MTKNNLIKNDAENAKQYRRITTKKVKSLENIDLPMSLQK